MEGVITMAYQEENKRRQMKYDLVFDSGSCFFVICIMD